MSDYQNSQNSLFGVKVPDEGEPFIPSSESFPGLPEWLKDNRGRKKEKFKELFIIFISADENSHTAHSIASDFETGRLPGGIDNDLAIKWYKHAAAIGSAEAAMRVHYLEDDSAFLHLALLNSAHGFDNVLTIASAKLQLGIFIYAAKKLQEIDQIDTNITKKIDYFKNRIRFKSGYTDILKELNRLQLNLLGAKSEALSHNVISHEISEDGDFKLGIYRILQTRLPLIVSETNPELIYQTLDSEFPWFHRANQLVYKQMQARLQSSQPAFKLRPLLLAGTPGIGKTSWAKRLAELCEIPISIVMGAGSSDSMHLKGLARGWSSSRPSALAHLIATERVANPLMVVDEIDKASSNNRNGSILDVLLQLIEPATSKNYLDECLQVPCDFSWVSWIATCNTLGGLPKPLLDRFTVVLIDKPGPEHSKTIIKGAIKAYARELNIDERMLPILDGHDVEILHALSPREINRVVSMMLEDRLTETKKPAFH